MEETTTAVDKMRKALALKMLARFRVMDDTFMRQVFKDNLPLTQHVLRIITGIDDLCLEESETQRDLKSIEGSRSGILDVYGVDTNGTQYNLEVQNGDTLDANRTRYYSATMDIDYLLPRERFAKLPEQWVIFILECDTSTNGQARRQFENRDAFTGNLLGDGTHKLIVNGAYRGDDALGSLMADFCERDPNKIRDPLLRERVQYLKQDPKGVSDMCAISEEIFNKGREVGLEQGHELGREEGAVNKLLSCVRSLMETMGWTVQEALKNLKVPEEERARYLAML
jgi:hypothetical protein